MWPFTRPTATPAAPHQRPLVERVEELEDSYHRLERRFVRLQGEFNATTRAVVNDDDEEYDDGEG
jgi:hypothetical protein